MAENEAATAEAKMSGIEGGAKNLPANKSESSASGSLNIIGLMNAIVRRSDLIFAFSIIFILFVLIFPIPSQLLDVLLAISIAFSVLVLMTVIAIEEPLEFSTFPTVLLLATMIRLALNLASTRLILANGHQGTDVAGDVIQAFGGYVMQNNFVIGIIIFAILIIVNFVVITKGSGRIAEVAARFTLDAMPGKQMAIDADLSAGLIEEEEARKRRKKLENESSFFGSMDGASKFVRGDAIAGLLITFINIIGGMIIGVAQMGITFNEAAQTYTLLTVGDGLVSQVPALIVSTSAGLLVSKAGVEESADKALFKQLSGYPKSLYLSSGLMGLMAFLPGLPFIPFMVLSLAIAGIAYKSNKTAIIEATEKSTMETAVKEEGGAVSQEDSINKILEIDDIRIEVGYSLLPMVNDETSDNLTEQIKALRRQIAKDLGFVIPSVRIIDSLNCESNEYVIFIKEIEAGRGMIYANRLMVMDTEGKQPNIPGFHAVEPSFGLPATWIEHGDRSIAEEQGYTVVYPSTVMATHLTELIKVNISDIFTYSEARTLLDNLKGDDVKLLEELVPSQISFTGLQRILQGLLTELVSIRDMSSILGAVAEVINNTQNTRAIIEHVRSRLGRYICSSNLSDHGYLGMISLSTDWERKFSENLAGEGDNKYLAMAPSIIQDFVMNVHNSFEEASNLGESPILVTSQQNRFHVRNLIERFRPQTAVIGQNEVPIGIKLKTIAQI